MNISDCEKFNHHKPPYEYKRKIYHSCVRDVNLLPCPIPRKPEKCKCVQECAPSCAQPDDRGLLRYRSWWERIEVCLSVGGEQINGVPIFVKDNTLRIINNDYSYFVPLSKVDYIRTNDGLCSCTGLTNG